MSDGLLAYWLIGLLAYWLIGLLAKVKNLCTASKVDVIKL